MTRRPSVPPRRSALRVHDPTCEYLANPLGIETARPRLSWKLRSERREERQTAYEVQAASDRDALERGKSDLWKTGKVRSSQSVHVEYAGRALRSRQGCWWRVRVWDARGRASPYSPPAYFEMGLLRPSDWRARWITCPPITVPDVPEQPSPVLRKAFRLDRPPVSARAYVSGLGYFELYVNGRRIGDHVLDPAFTRYDRRALYVTHDVTGALAVGENVLGVMLGNGWYNCQTAEVWNFQQAPWRDRPKLLLQLHVTSDDGTETVVCSDGTWRASTGPVIFDALRNGETCDARQEKAGWDTAAYDDRGADWHDAQILPGPGGTMHAQQHTPIRVTGTVDPVALREVRPGVFVCDMGRTFSGWARVGVSGPAGTQVTLRYAEKLLEDGDIDQSNIAGFLKSGDCQTDRYTLKGEGLETWEPRFTYHGFRYIQVTGWPGKPAAGDVRSRVVHTDFARRGEFACSNELLNRIHVCVLGSTLSNYHGLPTDCPHREKNGWTGDAHLSAEQVLYNFNAESAYTKWIDDFADVQRPSGQLPGIVPTGGWGYNWGSGPAWDSAYLLIPWYLYRYRGDARLLERHYEGMRRYVDFLGTIADGHIVRFGLGDWCPPTGGADSHVCPAELTSTAYYCSDARIVSQAAALAGKAADARKYSRLAEAIRQAFLRRYYDPASGQLTGRCQTSLATALYHDLLPTAERPKVLRALLEEIDRRDGHIDCGILGTKYVMHCLTDAGRADVAYRIATQEDFPSWGHWIRQGATTLWERWDGEASRCHHMFSDIGAWFYKALGGIVPETPGFRRVTIRPNVVGDLEWVRADHKSPFGTIRSHWRREGNRLVMEVAVPPNSDATVYVPAAEDSAVSEGGRPVRRAPGVALLRTEPGRAVFNVCSGTYVFASELPG